MKRLLIALITAITMAVPTWADSTGGGNASGGAPTSSTYVTSGDETGTLTNSRQLVDGTNTTIDTSTPGQIKVNASGGGGSPGGANTNVQYNSTGSFAGSANFTYSEATNPILQVLSPGAGSATLNVGGDYTSTTPNASLNVVGTASSSISVGNDGTNQGPSLVVIAADHNAGAPRLEIYDKSGAAGYIQLFDEANSGSMKLQTPSTLTGDRTFTMPDANCNAVQPSVGSAGQYVEYIDSDGVQHLSTPAGGIVDNAPASVAGSTSGTLKWHQPLRGQGMKKVIIYLDAFDDSGETVTYSTAFTYAPAVIFNNTTVTPSSVTSSAITLPSTGGAQTGWIILEGF